MTRLFAAAHESVLGTDMPKQHRDVRCRWMNGPGSSMIAGQTILFVRATGAGLPRPRRAAQRLRRLAEGADEGAAHPLRIAKAGGLRDAPDRFAGGLHALPGHFDTQPLHRLRRHGAGFRDERHARSAASSFRRTQHWVGSPRQNPKSPHYFFALKVCLALVLSLIGGDMQNLWKTATAILLSFVLMGSASAQVVALGASNTQGHGVGASESYPAQLQAMLQARGSGLRVTNAGVFGDTTDGMLARLSNAVPDGTKIVILQFGGNDRGKISLATRQANIATIQQQLRKRGIRIVQADGLVRSAWAAGLVQPDHVHLTAEGYRRVAAQLLPSIH
jgi:acyl-CoA thioesterase-1